MTTYAGPSAALLIPEGHRLLHIGPHKTGTTSLQFSAAGRRDALREHGVRYPGRRLDHSRPALGAMGRAVGWTALSGEQARPELWDGLVGEIDGSTDRVLISSEMFCDASAEEIARVVTDLDAARTHVVITLRPLARILPSAWQQGLKAGRSATIDEFLQRQLAEGAEIAGGDAPRINTLWWRQEHGGLVQRWAEAVGPDRVTVVVLDPADHAFLGHTFESLLGLPAGLLDQVADAPRNRSMTAAEAEMLRLANATLAEARMKKADYGAIVRHGGVTEMITARRPGRDEVPITLPASTAEPVLAMARFAVDRIRASGVDVVGDLDTLLQSRWRSRSPTVLPSRGCRRPPPRPR